MDIRRVSDAVFLGLALLSVDSASLPYAVGDIVELYDEEEAIAVVYLMEKYKEQAIKKWQELELSGKPKNEQIAEFRKWLRKETFKAPLKFLEK